MITIPGVLDGRVALVTGGRTAFGRELCRGLTDAGAQVVGIDGGFSSRADAEQALAAHPHLDAVVHARVGDGALVATTLVDTDDTTWDARCEALLRDALFTFQAAFTALSAGGGGRIVLIAPTVAMSGAAELVPYVTAVEGMRSLAKGAARQWGEHGITVNCVSPPLDLLAPGFDRPTVLGGPIAFVAEPAIGHLPDIHDDVAAVVALLVSSAAPAVTGATVVVDGGTVMVP